MRKATCRQLLTACRVRGLHIDEKKTGFENKLRDWAKKNEISNSHFDNINWSLEDSLMVGNLQTSCTNERFRRKNKINKPKIRSSSKPNSPKQSINFQTKHSRTKTRWKVINLSDSIVVETDKEIKQIMDNLAKKLRQWLRIWRNFVKHRNPWSDHSHYFLVLTHLINDFGLLLPGVIGLVLIMNPTDSI